MNTSVVSERSSNGHSPSHQEIASRAHALWIECGEPKGCDDEIWYEAERRLLTVQPLPRAGASLIPVTVSAPGAAPYATPFQSNSETLRSRRELLSDLAALGRPPIAYGIGFRASSSPPENAANARVTNPGES